MNNPTKPVRDTIKEILFQVPKGKILDHLSDENIFSVGRHQNGYLFTEDCDRYFQTALTRGQMKQLIQELQELIGDE